MINFLGKSLAFVHVSLSILLLGFAFAIFLNPVDFGWKEPRRFWNDQPNKKEENLLVASEFDKAEAAMRKMLRFRDEELYHLGVAQEKLAAIEPALGKNHIKGTDLLEMLEKGKGAFNIDDLQFDAKGKLVLEGDFTGENADPGVRIVNVVPDSAAAKAGLQAGDVIVGLNKKDVKSYAAYREDIANYAAGDRVTLNIIRAGAKKDVDLTLNVSFPQLAEAKRDLPINMSFASYVVQLRKLDADIDKVEAAMKDLVAKEVAITLRLIGDTSQDGTPRRHADGSIIRPGWHYLIELEMDAQQQLKKELEYLQPLWVKELVDAQLLVSRRDVLLQRLAELGQVEGKAFISRYDYPKMQLQKK
jgi:membrane-associated protease RseP (regulator of RpoE activity)